MAGPYQGKDGLVYVGTTAVGSVTDWKYSEGSNVDVKVVKGTTNKAYSAGTKTNGGGSFSVLLDPADSGQAALTPGASVTLKLYQGGASGIERSGSVIITGRGHQSPLTGHNTRTYNYKGFLTVA